MKPIRVGLTILLLGIMPTLAQGQREFGGTFRCTTVDVMTAHHPDGRLHPVKAESWADKELIAFYRSFMVVDVSNRTRNQDIGGTTWTVVHPATENRDFFAVRSLSPPISLHVRTWMQPEPLI